MIISEKHLRKVIREIIIESDGEATSYEVVRDEVEAEHNRPKSPDQVTTDQVTTDEYTRLLNPSNKRNQLTDFSSSNQPSQFGLDHLINLDNTSQNNE